MPRDTYSASGLAHQLIRSGYNILPIPYGEKGPKIKSWNEKVFDEHDFEGENNIGVKLGNGLIAIDLDIYKEDVVAKFIEAFNSEFREFQAELDRVGEWPKQLIVVRSDIDSKTVFKLPFIEGKKPSNIEILSQGQQFVAHGLHPDTGEHYKWLHDDIADLGLNDIPRVDADKLLAFIEDFAKDYGYKPRANGAGDDDDGLSLAVAMYDREMNRVSYDECKDILRKINPKDTDYEQWVRVGMALHHNFNGGDEGRKLWGSWSKLDADRFDPSTINAKWSGFKLDAEKAVTIGSLIDMAGGRNAVAAYGYGEHPEWVHVIDTDRGQRLLPTKDNLAALIDWSGIYVGYDVYGRCIIAEQEGEDISHVVDSVITDLCVKEGLSKASVQDYLMLIAHEREVNKPLTWLKGLGKYEGDPLGEWLKASGLVSEALGPIQEQWPYIVWKRFFIATCAAADQLENTPNKDAIDKFEQVVVLVSNQGMKKSSAISGLLPKELRNYCAGGVNLNLSNKDSYIEATSYWIAELGELDATFRKSDIAALKAFLSRRFDEIRMPYDRRAVKYKRRTVYYGSVNEKEFLKDSTGNRRYLPVDMTQSLVYSEEMGRGIFAQAWERYVSGEQWWLTDDEEKSAEEVHKSHDGNPIISGLLEAFDFDSPKRDFAIKPGVMLTVLGYRASDINRNKTAIRSALMHLGIERYGTTAREQRHYAMPPLAPGYRQQYEKFIGTDAQEFPSTSDVDDFQDDDDYLK